MGRNRRMPPLFEVMRQTNPGSPPTPGGADAATPGPGDPASNQAFFRAHTQAETLGTAALRLTPHPEAESAPSRPTPAAAAVTKPVEVRVGQARRNWVVEDTTGRGAGPAGAEAGEPSHDGPRPMGARSAPIKSPLTIPGTWLAVAAAIAVTLIVVVWIVAYRQGSSAKELEFQDKLSSSAPAGPAALPKPSAGGPAPSPSGAGLAPENRPAREPAGTQPPKTDPGSTSKPSAPPAPAPAPKDPAPAVDPRQAETNYLSVLTFRSKDDAVELAKYLTTGGLPAATVALKASGGGAPVGWEVFVLQGIPSVDFRRADDARNAIHRTLEELGRAWNQEGRSRLNLSRDNVTWRKHKPGS